MKDNPHTEYVRMSRVDLLREALELRHRIAGQERENAELRERAESLEGALQRIVYRTEQLLDEMENRSIKMPVWIVMTVQEALRLAHAALSQAEPANAELRKRVGELEGALRLIRDGATWWEATHHLAELEEEA